MRTWVRVPNTSVAASNSITALDDDRICGIVSLSTHWIGFVRTRLTIIWPQCPAFSLIRSLHGGPKLALSPLITMECIHNIKWLLTLYELHETTSIYTSVGTYLYPHMPILLLAIYCSDVRGPRAGRFAGRYWASGRAKFTKMGVSLPWTSMSRRAKLDAASFIPK